MGGSSGCIKETGEGAGDHATPTVVGLNKDGGPSGPLDVVVHLAETTVKDGLDVLAHSRELARDLTHGVIAALDPTALPRHVETAFEFVKHPVKLLDALTSYSSEDNEVTNSWREIGRLLLSEKADAEAWSGHPQKAKSVAWSAGIDLGDVKAIATAYEGTVNDVLMSAVSLALSDYLRERGVHDIHDPVSYTHLRAHETVLDLVCRLLLEKKKPYPSQLN